MEIRIGKYILRSDERNYWIEEEYISKGKNGKEKTYTRMVTGYAWTIDSLIRQFTEHKHRAVEAETVKELITEFKQIAEDTIAIKKTAIEKDLKLMRKTEKKIKELNK